VQHPDQPVHTDVMPVQPADPKPRLVHKPQLPSGSDLLPEIRRYLMMRRVVLIGVCVLLILHWVFPGFMDFTAVLLIACVYALAVGSGGLEAARLSGTGGDQRRQERLSEDALKRAGRLQSHLEPGTASDEVVQRILAGGDDPRRAVILSGNEVEDALRAVYRHFAENERLAGTSTGADLPLTFIVQELIWRGLLAPDIYDTAEPVLALRDLAQTPRVQIEQRTANDAARAAQAVVLRVESLGIEIRSRRVPLAWMRNEHSSPRAETGSAPLQRPDLAVAPPADPSVDEVQPEGEDLAALRFPRPVHEESATLETQALAAEQEEGIVREDGRELNRQEAPLHNGDGEPTDR
jgi:hypothetical protein